MGLLYLLLGVFCAVVIVMVMKWRTGCTRVIPSIFIVSCYLGSLWFLALAVRRIDVSVVYVIWTSLGTAMMVLGGLLSFAEQMTIVKFVSILLIVSGVIGLSLHGDT